MLVLTITQKKIRAKKELESKLYKLEYFIKLKEKKMIKTSQKNAQKQITKIKKKIENEKTRKIKKYKKQYEQKIKNIEREEKGKKKVSYKKEDKSISRYKKNAIKLFQEWIRYRDCVLNGDENGYGIMIDKEEYRNMKGCHAGHYFPKHNYPQLIFNEDNCHAQTPGGNYAQMDKIGLAYDDRIIKRIGKKRYDDLWEISKDKSAKEKAKRRGKKYYQDIIEEYTKRLQNNKKQKRQ